MIQMVRYFYLNPGEVSERNAGIAVVFGNWPPRVMKQRGWTPERQVCDRLATEGEHEWLASCHRHQAYRYRDVDSLLADEAEYLDPEVHARISKQLRQRVH